MLNNTGVQNVAAAACAITLTVGMIGLAFVGKPAPDYLVGVLGGAYGWLFSRAANGAGKKLNGANGYGESEGRTP